MALQSWRAVIPAGLNLGDAALAQTTTVPRPVPSAGWEGELIRRAQHLRSVVWLFFKGRQSTNIRRNSVQMTKLLRISYLDELHGSRGLTGPFGMAQRRLAARCKSHICQKSSSVASLKIIASVEVPNCRSPFDYGRFAPFAQGRLSTTIGANCAPISLRMTRDF